MAIVYCTDVYRTASRVFRWVSLVTIVTTTATLTTATLTLPQAAQAHDYFSPRTDFSRFDRGHRFDRFDYRVNHPVYRSNLNNPLFIRPVLINPIGNSIHSSDCWVQRQFETTADGRQVEVTRLYGDRCYNPTVPVQTGPSIQFSVGVPSSNWHRSVNRPIVRFGYPRHRF
jgi:hypothetical protein